MNNCGIVFNRDMALRFYCAFMVPSGMTAEDGFH
jgi:hypothetical protein